jgi:DNA-binding NarL/FixJ family response regulator
MRTVRAVLIDDSELVRPAVRGAVDRIEVSGLLVRPRLGKRGIAVVRELNPEVVIVDAAVEGIDGAETTRGLLAAMPRVRVVGYSGDASNESALLAAGAAASVTSRRDLRSQS